MEKKFGNKRLNTIFEESKDEMTYDQLKNLMMDVLNNDLQENVSKKDAEDAIRTFMLKVFDVTPEELSRPRIWRKAMKNHMDEFFEIIEDIIEEKLDDSLRNNDYMQFAEYRNLNEGDKNEFWVYEKDTVSVARVSGDHHDLSLQHFKKPSKFTVGVQRYGAKIGDDIRQYLSGRKNLTEQINLVVEAFDEKIATDVVAAIANVGDKIPANADLNVAITMPANATSDQKATIRDQIIEIIGKVKDVNNSEVIMMGTRNAIRKLEGIQDLDWLSEAAKEDKYRKLRIAYFDEASLVEVPQKYTKENNKLKALLPDDNLLIVPVNSEKFIKIVNSGDTATELINEVGAYVDDMTTYEVQKSYGVATIVGQYMGVVKFN